MQANINICSPDSSIVVKRGLFNLREERECAINSVRYVLTDLSDIQKSFFRLGFHLYELKNLKYYEDFGFPTMEEFCAMNFGMDKSAVSRCINVFLFTCVYDHYGSLPTCYMDDRFKEYSYSQLCEMLTVNEKLLPQITPDMTVKQIREIKKNNKSVVSDNQVATSQLNNFDYDKYLALSGAALYSYIKKCDPTDSILIHVFDRDGKPIAEISNLWYDLLAFDKSNNRLIVRM